MTTEPGTGLGTGPGTETGTGAISGAGRVAVRERLRTAWRLFREFSGERAYEIYVEHQQLHHPGEPVMSEREFWRRQTDQRDDNPRVVCC